MASSQSSGFRGRSGRQNDKGGADHPNSAKLCPLLAEYCKGPKCMFYQHDLDVCTIPLGLEAFWMMSRSSGVKGELEGITAALAKKFSAD